MSLPEPETQGKGFPANRRLEQDEPGPDTPQPPVEIPRGSYLMLIGLVLKFALAAGLGLVMLALL